MYQKGDLKLLDPPCNDEHYKEWKDTRYGHSGRSCENYDHKHSVGDDRSFNQKADCIPPCAYLPHSCDEWVIGDVEQVQALIDDLTAVKKEMEE